MTPITDPDFMYIKAAFTDITKVWRKYGWIPPDRTKQDQMRLALNRLDMPYATRLPPTPLEWVATQQQAHLQEAPCRRPIPEASHLSEHVSPHGQADACNNPIDYYEPGTQHTFMVYPMASPQLTPEADARLLTELTGSLTNLFTTGD